MITSIYITELIGLSAPYSVSYILEYYTESGEISNWNYYYSIGVF